MKKSNKNNSNNKSINIIEIKSKKIFKNPHSPILYNNYLTNLNNNYFYDNSIKTKNRNSNSSDKAQNYNRPRYSPYNNNYNSNFTLGKYNNNKTNKKKHLKSRSNSGSKNNSKSKSRSKESSRPNTAPEKSKNSHKNKNNNFVGFKGIMNLRNNLISNTGNKGSTNKRKEKIIAISKNIGNNNNNFGNFINEGNRLGISQMLFGNNNNKKMNSPITFGNQSKSKNKNSKNEKYRLASPNYSNGLNIIRINQVNTFSGNYSNGKKK